MIHGPTNGFLLHRWVQEENIWDALYIIIAFTRLADATSKCFDLFRIRYSQTCVSVLAPLNYRRQNGTILKRTNGAR